MPALSDYLEAKTLNWTFRNTSMGTAPANVYLALFSTAPNDDASGTELTGNAYARVAVSTTGGFTAPTTGGLVSNVSDIVFPTASPSGWSAASYGAFFDAATAGNLLTWGPLQTPVTVGAGQVFRVLAGQFQFTLD